MAKQTAKQKYQSAVRRIIKRYTELQEQGYFLPDLSLPKQPKNYSTKRLKKYTKKYLASTGEYVSRETGEVIKGAKAYQQQRSESARRSAQTRKRNQEIQKALKEYGEQYRQYTQPTQETILSTQISNMIKYVLDYIDSMPSTIYNGSNKMIIEDLKDQLASIVTSNIDSIGYNEYNKYLSENEEAIVNLCDVLDPYQKDGINTALSHISELSLVLNMGELNYNVSTLDSELQDSFGYDEE